MQIENLFVDGINNPDHQFAVDNVDYEMDNDGIGHYDSGGYHGYDKGNDFFIVNDFDLYMVSFTDKTKRKIDIKKMNPKTAFEIYEQIRERLEV